MSDILSYTPTNYPWNSGPGIRGYPAEHIAMVSSKLKKQYELKLIVFLRDDFTCQGCGREFPKPDNFDGSQIIKGLTLGHIIPKSMNGRRTPKNLKAQCEKCNRKLGAKVWTKFIGNNP